MKLSIPVSDDLRYYFRDFVIFAGTVTIAVLLAEFLYFDSEKDVPFLERIMVTIYFIIPLFSLSLVISYIYRNRRNRQTGRLKSSIRYRLTLAFIFVALLPSIPVFVLTSNITGKVFEEYYGVEMNGTIAAAHDLILTAEKPDQTILREKAKLLFSITGTPNANLGRVLNRAKELDLLDESNYYISALDSDGRTIYESHVNGPHLAQGEFNDFGDHGFREYSFYSPSFCMYYVEIPFRNLNGKIRIGKRTHINAEPTASAIEQTRTNYLSANLGREKLPYGVRLTIGILTILVFLLSILFSLVFARKISRPIIELANATQKVSMGMTDITLNIREDGEMGVLIDSFNQMVKDLKSKNDELMHTQRIAAWKEVAQRIAHEIKNPLTPIQLSAERIRKKMHKLQGVDKEFADSVEMGTETIVGQVKVLEHLVGEFSEFARMPAPVMINQRIEPIIRESVKLFEHSGNIEFELKFSKMLPELFLDRKLVLGIFNNLIKNAVEAIEKKKDGARGKIRITASMDRKIIRKVVLITVEDSGVGLQTQLRPKIFQPYFSTKDGHTSGIGLAIVQKTVIDHNGHISVENSELGGCKFRIEFPIA